MRFASRRFHTVFTNSLNSSIPVSNPKIVQAQVFNNITISAMCPARNSFFILPT